MIFSDLPPHPPAIIRAHDLRSLPSWAEMQRREKAIREGTFPFPVFCPAPPLGGNDAFTIALLHGDGADTSTTITNSAAGGSTAFTANNGAQIDTDQSKFGGASILFDGVNDQLSFDGSGTDWTWAGDFTIDFWFRSTSSALEGGGQQRLFSFGTGATNIECYIDNSPAGEIVVETGAGTEKSRAAGTDYSDSAWHHFAYARSSGTAKLFIDGVEKDSDAEATSWAGNATSYWGRYQGSALGHYVGHLDEIRVSKGIARWTAAFTPPTVAYS